MTTPDVPPVPEVDDLDVRRLLLAAGLALAGLAIFRYAQRQRAAQLASWGPKPLRMCEVCGEAEATRPCACDAVWCEACYVVVMDGQEVES